MLPRVHGLSFVIISSTRLHCPCTEQKGRVAARSKSKNTTICIEMITRSLQRRFGVAVLSRIDNKWAKVPKGHVFQAYRQFHRSPHWGIANGQNPYDDNDPNGIAGYWETGKHTGPNGATELTDSTKNWVRNQWSTRSHLHRQKYNEGSRW